MEHSYRFFENRDCEYFPCHQGLTELNCLFCYCPLYGLEHCLGGICGARRKTGKRLFKLRVSA